ncbi:MAG: transketolase [Lachnospiraceae bacterium]|nr:transketolase [Lachnospiraceae bacterium]
MMDDAKKKALKRFSIQTQMEIVKMISRVPAGHIGGSLSITDLLSVLYNKHMKIDPKNPKWENRDWLVLSKGHCGPALYATLALKGYFPMEQLETLNSPGTNLPSHADRNRTVGIDMTTGSLGQGASTAAGVAVGMKMDGKDNKVYLILGDGELNEGQVWEMAMMASTKKLDNLIAFVDYNKLQIDGRTDTDEVCNLGDICAKFAAFGWYAQRVDGHDIEAIDEAIANAKDHKGDPSVIVLDTVKGNGWSRIADTAGSHSRGVSPEELEEALAEMQTVMDNI